jgi:TonB family protein
MKFIASVFRQRRRKRSPRFSEESTVKAKRQKAKGKRAALVSFCFCLLLCHSAPAQETARVAVADFTGDGQSEAGQFRQMVAQEYALIDEGLVRAALRGSGYTSSLNLSREEARALGMSIGCDYYLLGAVRVARRIVSAEEFYYDGIAGIFTIETRSGRLLLFDFSRTKTADEKTARAQLDELLRQSWRKSSAAISRAVSRSYTESAISNLPPAEVIEVLGDETLQRNLAQPVFYQRLKPRYTEEAESLSIVATVELEAVFREDGQVGEVEVMRWAGFGLDESAVATLRQLRFKPAERAGKKVSLRALVRYNFRRPPTAAEAKEETERLKRSLRDAQRQPKP